MEYLVIAVLATAAIVFITYPLFGRQRRLHRLEDAFEFGNTEQLDYLNLKKSRIEENLKELEFEYEMGKLSDQDHARLKTGYVSELEKVAISIDQLNVKKEIEGLIENEVRSRRRIK